MCICVCVCVCVCVYLGSKSPAAGPSLAMRLCVRTYSSVFGEGIMRDERPTSTKQDEGKNGERERERERVHLLTACSPPVSSFFCSPAPLSECFYPKSLAVPGVLTFLASVAPLGLHRQPPLTTATLVEAVPSSASRALRDHTLLSSSLVLLLCRHFCKLLEHRPAFS